MSYKIYFLAITFAGLLVVWLSSSYGWYWGVVMVLVLAAIVTRHDMTQFRTIEHWLQERAGLPKPSLSWRYGQLVTMFSRLYMAMLARLAHSNRLLARIRRTARDLPVAVVVLDHRSRIEWANDKAAELLAVRWPTDANLPFQHLCRDFRLRHALQHNAGDCVIELPGSVVSGSWIQIQIFHHKNMILVLGNDITEAVNVRRMRRDFVTNASHELRTPLTVMASISETIHSQKEQAPSHWRQPIELLRRKVLAMISLVEDMLSLSSLDARNDSPGNIPEYQSVTVASLCDQVLQDFSGLLQDNNIKIKLDLVPGININGSPTELYSVLANLVKNAITYSDSGDGVTISWSRDKDGGCLQVADNGVGIESHHLPHLTERFYRVDDQRHRDGTGLGLAIVRNILQRHDARLEITSAPGKGSEFSCYFPENRLC